MMLAFKSFLGFSVFTFILFGLTASDNKYKDYYKNSRSNALVSLCNESHLYQNTSQYTALAIKSNGYNSFPAVGNSSGNGCTANNYGDKINSRKR